jgi:hypothetical protein
MNHEQGCWLHFNVCRQRQYLSASNLSAQAFRLDVNQQPFCLHIVHEPGQRVRRNQVRGLARCLGPVPALGEIATCDVFDPRTETSRAKQSAQIGVRANSIDGCHRGRASLIANARFGGFAIDELGASCVAVNRKLLFPLSG